MATAEPPEEIAPLNPGDEAAPGSPGIGEAICRECAGSGVVDGEVCANCGGTGRVTVAEKSEGLPE